MGARAEAMAAGATTYFTGKPCAAGHIEDRFTVNGTCRACAKAACAKYGAAHQEERAAYHRAFRSERPEEMRRRWKAQRVERAESVKAAQTRWNMANREKRREYARETAHKRRAAKRGAGSDLTRSQIAEIADLQKHRCAYCKAKAKLTLDHITPLARGGANTRSNIQMLCAPCNLSKGAKRPEDFARSRGLLL